MSDTLNRVDAVALVLADFFYGSTDVTNGGVLAAARLAVDAADAAVNYQAASDRMSDWYFTEDEEQDVRIAKEIVDAALGRQSNE